MTYTPEKRKIATIMLPFQRGNEFAVTQQCHVNALRDVTTLGVGYRVGSHAAADAHRRCAHGRVVTPARSR